MRAIWMSDGLSRRDPPRVSSGPFRAGVAAPEPRGPDGFRGGASADGSTPQDQLKQIEIAVARELESLGHIVAAGVDLSEAGRVRAIYLAVRAGAKSNDIRASALDVLGSHGLACRPDAISIAVAPEPPPPPGAAAGRGRMLVFGGLDLKRASHHVTCRVELIHGEARLVSEVRELDTDGGGARAAARATLLAAEQAVTGVRFGLEGAATLELFGRRHVAVSVEAADSEGVRRVARLYGLAVVERSAEDAACLAVLGAIERWLNGPRSRRHRAPDS
jgi:hypothetical protein